MTSLPLRHQKTSPI